MTNHDRMRVAVEAAVSATTVSQYLKGGSLMATTRARVERAMRVCKLAAYIRPRPIAPASPAAAGG